jgi:hypothetical protein
MKETSKSFENVKFAQFLWRVLFVSDTLSAVTLKLPDLE